MTCKDCIYDEVCDLKRNHYYLGEPIGKIDEVEVGAINIYNPLTGTIDPIGTVIDDLYNQLRYNAITATEYDGLELTATTYDGYMITANNFDLNGKSILMGN